MATAYKQPRRLNLVSGFMLLLLGLAGYWCWKFLPVYLEAWSVDHVLNQNVSQVYKMMRLAEPYKTTELTKLVEIAKADILKKTGVTDTNVVVNLNIELTIATLTADYTVQVTHEWFSRTTIMAMHRTAVGDIKRVDWEK